MPKNADFAHKLNIENFRRQLTVATDEKQLATLRKLLAEELAREKPPSVG